MSSYVMEGILSILTGPTLLAKVLRDNFLFFIVPMLNIDGVVVGNYRANLSAVDLNRQYVEPSKKNHPTIFYTKQLLKKVCEEKDLFLYLDLHAHNRRKNIFMCKLLWDFLGQNMVFSSFEIFFGWLFDLFLSFLCF